MLLKKKLLQFFYNALLTGMPTLTYNPYNKNILHAPFTVNTGSTYINYKLNNEHIYAINNFMKIKNNNDFKLIKTRLTKTQIAHLYDDKQYYLDNDKEYYLDSDKDYYLSINIYNCSSPIFNFISEDPVTRCELNVYVVNKNNEQGTMILDYASNILSLDPDNIFKRAGNASFNIFNDTIFGNVNSDDFTLNFDYNNCNSILYNKKLSDNLINLCDKIYYPNGYYDKLYFDSSLLNNDIIKCNNYNVYFKFLDIEFSELDIDSIFYFTDKINFVGGMWENIFTKV